MGLVDSVEQIERKMLGVLRDDINSTMKSAAPRIQTKIQQACFEAITSSEVYKSLSADDGELRTSLGIDNQVGQLAVILDYWISTISVTVEPLRVSGGGFVGGVLSITGCGLQTFNDIKSVGTVDTARGEKIPWLEWLNLEGERVLVKGYDVKNANAYEKYSGISRTRSNIMAKGENYKWAIPSWAAGTKNDNWVTKALLTVDVASIVESELMK